MLALHRKRKKNAAAAATCATAFRSLCFSALDQRSLLQSRAFEELSEVPFIALKLKFSFIDEKHEGKGHRRLVTHFS